MNNMVKVVGTAVLTIILYLIPYLTCHFINKEDGFLGTCFTVLSILWISFVYYLIEEAQE